MKKMLNTLYITSEDIYLSLDGENVVANLPDTTKQCYPLHTLESIVTFSYKGASPALLGKCLESGISVTMFSPRGYYLAQVGNDSVGNVLLRRTQFRIADDPNQSLEIAKNFIIGKLYNSKFVLLRCARDHALRVDAEKLRTAAEHISNSMHDILNIENIDTLRGCEGNAAAEYFNVFSEMILQNSDEFPFNGRNRRPPRDRVNAMLSLAYSLLTTSCVSGLRAAGLDPYVGFMHTDRPGRKSLALDLVEELRSVYADRFVLTLINNRIITGDDFENGSNGAILLNNQGRKKFLTEWQARKRKMIKHPFLGETIEWGSVPYAQSLLLARYLRGDLDAYPPFFWK